MSRTIEFLIRSDRLHSKWTSYVFYDSTNTLRFEKKINAFIWRNIPEVGSEKQFDSRAEKFTLSACDKDIAAD